jgi:hypothetical protein
MGESEIWSVVWSVVGALGGVGVLGTAAGVVGGFVAKHIASEIIETHKGELAKELEKYKSELNGVADRNRLFLKRQELMFDREYAAASDFYMFFDGVLPRPRFPEMDWSEAQEDIAEDFGLNAMKLGKIIESHSASLSVATLEKLKKARRLADEGLFAVGEDTGGDSYGPNLYPSDNVRAKVDEFYALLKDIEKQIRHNLERGSFSTSNDQL